MQLKLNTEPISPRFYKKSYESSKSSKQKSETTTTILKGIMSPKIVSFNEETKKTSEIKESVHSSMIRVEGLPQNKT